MSYERIANQLGEAPSQPLISLVPSEPADYLSHQLFELLGRMQSLEAK
jgi:hypothetical protein